MKNKTLHDIYEKCRPIEALNSQKEFNSADILIGAEVEKFAELIVRECLSYAKDGDLDFMKFMIKKHFGIEE